LPPRALSWDGCLNVRDLGGHETEGGGHTLFRTVVRADSVRQLSDRGWEALVDYGVRTIIDLRVDSEVAADPPRELPVDVVRVPVLPELGTPFWAEVDALTFSIDDPVEERKRVYLMFLDRYGRNFGRVVTEVARAPEGTVLVHCLGGKDRTGLVAALLLRLAGVPVTEVAADYALSETALRDDLAAWVADADDERERLRRMRIGAAPAAAMRGVLEELEGEHGSVHEYLAGVGVVDLDLERARRRLVG
jgi:protein tyrosine/serine phosphatase